jgi:hypothetical protein
MLVIFRYFEIGYSPTIFDARVEHAIVAGTNLSADVLSGDTMAERLKAGAKDRDEYKIEKW